MTEIVPLAFAFEGREVRVEVDHDGLPWWVISDVCSALDIANVGNTVSRLDEADIRTTDVRSGGQRRAVKVVNESGLFDLILDSRKPEARRFRRWVTSDVLPQIRKTGTYSPAATPVVLPTTRELALLVLAAEDRADAQAARADVAEQRNAELEPKAAAADALAEADGVLSIGAVANMFEIGRQKFFDLLRDEKILMRDRRPYQEYVSWFRVATKTYESSDGHRHAYYLSQLYPSGAVRLHALLTKRGYSLRKPVIDNQLRLLDGGAA